MALDTSCGFRSVSMELARASLHQPRGPCFCASRTLVHVHVEGPVSESVCESDRLLEDSS